jgi:hypothetical protein
MYSFFTAGEDLGNNAAPKVYGSGDEVNDKRYGPIVPFVHGTEQSVHLSLTHLCPFCNTKAFCNAIVVCYTFFL